MWSIVGIAALLLLTPGCSEGTPHDQAAQAKDEALSQLAEWSRIHPKQLGPKGSDRAVMSAVTPFENGFVAVGWVADGRGPNQAAAWLSRNGRTWTLTTSTTHGEAVMNDVAVLDDRLVAVGFDMDLDGTRRAAVWTSFDGRSWARVDADAPVFAGTDEDTQMNGVAVGGPGVVAVGLSKEDGAVWTSETASAWSRVRTEAALAGPARQELLRVTSHGGKLVAVGVDGGDAGTWISTNGSNWSRGDRSSASGLVGDGDQTAFDVAGNENHTIAVGFTYGGSSDPETTFGSVWLSNDAVTWRRAAPQQKIFGGARRLNAVIWTPAGFVAGGFTNAPEGEPNAAVWQSADGEAWRIVDDEATFGGPGNQIIYDVAANSEAVVAVGAEYGNPQAAVWYASVSGGAAITED
jgi:hypothetical protein